MSAKFFSGLGDPNGVVFGDPGDAYFNRSGGPSTFWVKESGVNTNTGWVALTSGGLLQTLEASIIAPTGIPGGGFAVIPGLVVPVVVGVAGNSLLLHFTVSGFQNAAGNSTFFRLRVDGVPLPGGTAFSRPAGGGPNGTASAAMVAKVPALAAGAHVVDVEATTTGGTTTIDPTLGGAAANSQHGRLLVEEVNV
jgi:hypothetical protein